MMISKKAVLVSILALLPIFSLQAQQLPVPNTPTPNKPMSAGYPVYGFFNQPLFQIYAKSGSFSARERSEAIEKRIDAVAKLPHFSEKYLTIVESENALDITYDQSVIMSVSDRDAYWNGTTKEELASRYKTIIEEAITHYRNKTSWIELLKNAVMAVGVLAVMSIFIVLTIKLFQLTHRKIQNQEGILAKWGQFKKYPFLDINRHIPTLLKLNAVLKWLVIAVIVYISLPILFGIFPWTENFAQTLFGYVLKPIEKIAIGLWEYLPNLITIIVVIAVFRFVLKILRILKTEIERGNLRLSGFYSDWANPTYQIARILVIAFMIVVIFPYLPGSNSPIFKGVSVFLGFLFTFGSAGSLSNIVAGLVLTYMRLFKLGDRVQIGNVTGDVIEKSLLVTRIRTIKNEIISIPNSTVMNSHTINYSIDAPDKGLIIHTTVTIGYDVPWREMHRALIDAAVKTEHILKEPVPFVLQTSLDDFYVSYEINAYIRDADKQALIYSELHQNIQDICNERCIEILSPHYRAQRDGNSMALPPNYLPKGYDAPGFKVRLDNKKN